MSFKSADTGDRRVTAERSDHRIFSFIFYKASLHVHIILAFSIVFLDLHFHGS